MLRQQVFDNIAVGVMIVIGLIFFVISVLAFKNVSDTCKVTNIKLGWTVIQAISACMVTTGVCFYICTLGGGISCYTGQSARSASSYFSLFVVFGIIMLSVSILVITSYSKYSEADISTCDSDSRINKDYVIFIAVLSGLMIIGSIFGILKVSAAETEEVQSEIENAQPNPYKTPYGVGNAFRAMPDSSAFE